MVTVLVVSHFEFKTKNDYKCHSNKKSNSYKLTINNNITSTNLFLTT